MLSGLGLGLLAAGAIGRHHQPLAGLAVAVGLALLLLALLAFPRSRRRQPPAGRRPRLRSGYPPGAWPEQPPTTRPIPAERPPADFDYWHPAVRHGVIDALDAGQLAEVVNYMADLDPELFGHAVRSLDEEA